RGHELVHDDPQPGAPGFGPDRGEAMASEEAKPVQVGSGRPSRDAHAVELAVADAEARDLDAARLDADARARVRGVGIDDRAAAARAEEPEPILPRRHDDVLEVDAGKDAHEVSPASRIDPGLEGGAAGSARGADPHRGGPREGGAEHRQGDSGSQPASERPYDVSPERDHGARPRLRSDERRPCVDTERGAAEGVALAESNMP